MLYASASPSTSSASRVMPTEVPSAVSILSLYATGASFTGSTVIVNLSRSAIPPSSMTRTITISIPFQSAVGNISTLSSESSIIVTYAPDAVIAV